MKTLSFLFSILFLTSYTVCLAVITITERSSLRFPDTFSDPYATQTVVVQATDGGAAVFDITGDPRSNIVVSIVETAIDMEHSSCAGSCSNALKIPVSSFTTGGSVNKQGAGRTNNIGELTNIRIGATASIGINQRAGGYSGLATVRIVYK